MRTTAHRGLLSLWSGAIVAVVAVPLVGVDGRVFLEWFSVRFGCTVIGGVVVVVMRDAREITVVVAARRDDRLTRGKARQH